MSKMRAPAYVVIVKAFIENNILGVSTVFFSILFKALSSTDITVKRFSKDTEDSGSGTGTEQELLFRDLLKTPTELFIG